MAGGRPRLFKTVKDLENTIDAYKKYLIDNDKPPTIAGLAYYTGIDRQTLYNYKKDMEYFDTIKRFVNWIIMNYEEIAIDKGNGGIVFLLKNYGYTDKQGIELTGKDGGVIEIDSPRERIERRMSLLASRITTNENIEGSNSTGDEET